MSSVSSNRDKQISDEILYTKSENRKSEASSSEVENDKVSDTAVDNTLTEKNLIGAPAGQHLYEQSSSNLRTPQYATFQYNSESRTMSSLSPNRDGQISDETLHIKSENRDSEASSSGVENDKVSDFAVDNILKEKNLIGAPAGQHLYEQSSSNLRTPQYATFHYNSEPRIMSSVSPNRDRQISDETLYIKSENRDSEASSSGVENEKVSDFAVDNILKEKNLIGARAGQHLYEQSASNLHKPQYATSHYNRESRTMSSVSPNRDRQINAEILHIKSENRDSEASSSGAKNDAVANSAVDNTLAEKKLTGGSGQQDNAKLKKKRMRTTYDASQLLYLENTFRKDKYPDRHGRINIAHKLKLSEKQIKIWFQNRRIKDKSEMLKTEKTCPLHKNANIGTATTFNLLNNSAPIQNQNLPILQVPYQFQYMPPPLGLNVFRLYQNYQSQRKTGHW